jgi:hypothetical protein
VADGFPSYLAIVMRSPRFLAQLLLLVAVGAAALTACGTDFNRFARQPGERSWAPLPAEVPMPAAAPDDPAVYRGVRYRPGGQTPGVRCCEARMEGASWLRVFPGSAVDAGGASGPFFGYEQVTDGRRRMVWFFRLVEPPSPLPVPSPDPVPPPVPFRHPVRAVLDAVVLPGEPEQGLGGGCGPDAVIIVGDDGWRLNRTTGRIEPVDPDDARCAD